MISESHSTSGLDAESLYLLNNYIDGHESAAQNIFERYAARLVGLVQVRLSEPMKARFDPEDVVQSAYRSFFRKARDDEFSLTRSGDLWRILAAFALNKTRSWIEREIQQCRDPKREVGKAEDIEALRDEPTPLEADILVEQLVLFMQQLSPRDRFILELRLQDKSVTEIANELAASEFGGFAEATIRRVLRNARAALERELFANDSRSEDAAR